MHLAFEKDVEYYSSERPHQSFEYKTPDEVYYGGIAKRLQREQKWLFCYQKIGVHFIYFGNKHADKYFNHENFLEIVLLLFFASHLVDRKLVDYKEVKADYFRSDKESFWEKYRAMVKDGWQKENRDSTGIGLILINLEKCLKI